eukprot:7941202-Pyramimonas_sp.AAC.1
MGVRMCTRPHTSARANAHVLVDVQRKRYRTCAGATCSCERTQAHASASSAHWCYMCTERWEPSWTKQMGE